MSIDRLDTLMGAAQGSRGLNNLEGIGSDGLIDLISDVLEDGVFSLVDEDAIEEWALALFDEFIAPQIRRPLVKKIARSFFKTALSVIIDRYVPDFAGDDAGAA